MTRSCDDAAEALHSRAPTCVVVSFDEFEQLRAALEGAAALAAKAREAKRPDIVRLARSTGSDVIAACALAERIWPKGRRKS